VRNPKGGYMRTEPHSLPLRTITVDPGIQPRVVGIDPEHVRALEESAGSWPPIVVVLREGSYLLVDGFHRLCAAQNLGLEAVGVRLVELPPGGDLHALAFQLNAMHGRPLSLADRRAFADRLLRLDPKLSDREVVRRCGLSSNTVGVLRAGLEASAQIEQTTERVGKGGYTYSVESDARQRPPGELPPVQFSESIGQFFSSRDRKNHRRIASYFQRLAVALEDQQQLDGYETFEEAGTACRLVLGDEEAAILAHKLGTGADDALGVAVELGYDPEPE
jgi:hypothetical protein